MIQGEMGVTAKPMPVPQAAKIVGVKSNGIKDGGVKFWLMALGFGIGFGLGVSGTAIAAPTQEQAVQEQAVTKRTLASAKIASAPAKQTIKQNQEDFNRLVAFVDSESLTRRKVELYRAGEIYQGLNYDKMVRRGQMSFQQALEELIDITLELQEARNLMGRERWQKAGKEIVTHLAKQHALSEQELIVRESRGKRLSLEEVRQNIAETALLHSYRSKLFADKQFNPSTEQLRQARALMEEEMIPEIQVITVKDRHYSLQDMDADGAQIDKQNQNAEQGKEAGGGSSKLRSNREIGDHQTLLQRITKIYQNQSELTKFLTANPHVQVQEYDWEEQTMHELPEMFVRVVAKLKRGETAAPILAPNGVHVVTLLHSKYQKLPKEVWEQHKPEISSHEVKAFLRRRQEGAWARARVKAEIRPQAMVYLVD